MNLQAGRIGTGRIVLRKSTTRDRAIFTSPVRFDFCTMQSIVSCIRTSTGPLSSTHIHAGEVKATCVQPIPRIRAGHFAQPYADSMGAEVRHPQVLRDNDHTVANTLRHIKDADTLRLLCTIIDGFIRKTESACRSAISPQLLVDTMNEFDQFVARTPREAFCALCGRFRDFRLMVLL